MNRRPVTSATGAIVSQMLLQLEKKERTLLFVRRVVQPPTPTQQELQTEKELASAGADATALTDALAAVNSEAEQAEEEEMIVTHGPPRADTMSPATDEDEDKC